MFDKLFTPITIKDMTLRNRIIMPAMGTRFTEDRFVNEKHIAYHIARARGGSALNIVEVSSVHALSAPKMFLSIAEDKYIPKLKELTDAIHAEGGKAGIQLWQGGLAVGMDQTAMILLSSDTELAPGFTVPGISKEMIAEVVDCYGKAAARAVAAGFDCIEFHCAHNYLPHSFLSDGLNHRTDEYGGSLENRARFPLECIRAIRAAMPEGMPLFMRIDAQDDGFGEAGLTVEDTITFCNWAKEAGVDVLDVSRGNIVTAASKYEVPPLDLPRGFNVDNAARIRKGTGMLTIGVGRINDPQQAEDILEADKVDMVVMGRAQLADPDFCNKCKEGRVEDIDRCVGCNQGCLDGFADLNMPGGSDYMEKEVLQAVKDGTLPESCVDDSARRVLKLVFRAAETLSKKAACDYEAHHALAKRAAAEGAVLLKNENGILPLKPGAKIAVIGAMAKELRYQGAGSSHINPTKLPQPLELLPGAVYAPGCDEKGSTTDALLQEVQNAARKAETVVVFAGLPAQCESEGFDRDNLKMPEGHRKMIETAAQANPNTVVVLLCGSVVECPWADKVKAILYMGLPGQAGGEAIADLLYGRANPGGKLAESWPYRYEDVPSSAIYGKTTDALYQEGVYVGYRYYDKAGVPVRWPFGYGLSYTEFSYSDLTVEDDTVTVAVRNTGKRAGAEVVQLYLAAPQDGIHRPVRELKGFQKVHLQPGESETVRFTLIDRNFAVWQDGWKVPGGTYTVCIGSLTAEIKKSGHDLPVPAWQKGSWYERCAGKPNPADWEKMLGHSYTPPVLKKGSFTMDNTVMEMKDYSLVMKIMFKAVESTVAKGFGGKKDYENPDFRMMMNASAGAPLRSMQISGGMKGGVLPSMLEMANGHFFRGVLKMIKG